MPVADKAKTDDTTAEPKAKQESDVEAELRRLREDNARMKQELAAKLPQPAASELAKGMVPDWSIEVQAYRAGTYGDPGSLHHFYREPGDVFRIKDEAAFSDGWMRRVGDTSQPKMSEIPGHGMTAEINPDIPQTGIRNQVKDPIQALADLAKRSAPNLAR